jgi:Phage integrase family
LGISKPGREAIDGSHFISRAWHPLLVKAGLRRGPFHTLRHTYASLLIMRGENLTYIKEQLGHSSIQVTVDLYGHLIPGVHRGAVDGLAEATKCNPAATSQCQDAIQPMEEIDLNGGPCRDRTYGPLIKSPTEKLSQDTPQEQSSPKGEDL